MSLEILRIVVAIFIPVIIALAGWMFKLQIDLLNHRIHTAETYVTKEEHDKDIGRIENKIDKGFRDIRARLDDIVAALNKKVDREELQ